MTNSVIFGEATEKMIPYIPHPNFVDQDRKGIQRKFKVKNVIEIGKKNSKDICCCVNSFASEIIEFVSSDFVVQ